LGKRFLRVGALGFNGILQEERAATAIGLELNPSPRRRASPAQCSTTVGVNWLVKPFSMALLRWLFIGILFRPFLPADQIDGYIAGLIPAGGSSLHSWRRSKWGWGAPSAARGFSSKGGDPLFLSVRYGYAQAVELVDFWP
jgi:hypothetical protein